MTQAVQERKEERKEKKDNLFLEILFNTLVQLPVMAIGWIIAQLTSE